MGLGVGVSGSMEVSTPLRSKIDWFGGSIVWFNTPLAVCSCALAKNYSTYFTLFVQLHVLKNLPTKLVLVGVGGASCRLWHVAQEVCA